jgi:hypothetical protein
VIMAVPGLFSLTKLFWLRCRLFPIGFLNVADFGWMFYYFIYFKSAIEMKLLDAFLRPSLGERIQGFYKDCHDSKSPYFFFGLPVNFGFWLCHLQM